MPVAVLSRRNRFIRASRGTLPELNVLITRRGFLPLAGGALLAPSATGFDAREAERKAGDTDCRSSAISSIRLAFPTSIT